MKIRTLAVVLFSASMCLSQGNNQSNSNDPTQAKANCAASCCKAMTENKDAKSCCRHDSAAKDGKASCRSGKDMDGNEPISCMKNDAKSGSAAANCCGKNDQKDCCAKSEKASEQAVMACCSGSTSHCAVQHHDDMGK